MEWYYGIRKAIKGLEQTSNRNGIHIPSVETKWSEKSDHFFIIRKMRNESERDIPVKLEGGL